MATKKKVTDQYVIRAEGANTGRGRFITPTMGLDPWRFHALQSSSYEIASEAVLVELKAAYPDHSLEVVAFPNAWYEELPTATGLPRQPAEQIFSGDEEMSEFREDFLRGFDDGYNQTQGNPTWFENIAESSDMYKLGYKGAVRVVIRERLDRFAENIPKNSDM